MVSNGWSLLEDVRALSENRYGFVHVFYRPQNMGGYRFVWDGPYTAVVLIPTIYYHNLQTPWKLTVLGSTADGERYFVARTDGVYALSAAWHWLQSLRHRTIGLGEFLRSLPHDGPGLVWRKRDETEWKGAINIGISPMHRLFLPVKTHFWRWVIKRKLSSLG